MLSASFLLLSLLTAAEQTLAGLQQPRSPATVLDDALRSKISQLVAENGVPGLAVGLLHVGAENEVEFGSWGNRTEAGAKVDENTIVPIGSMSKAFAATALGLVMDDFAAGRNVTPLPARISEFTWETKMKDLLPDEWKLADEWASEKANVRDLLSHVSGLARHDLAYERNQSASEMIKRMRYLRPAYELRVEFHYNSMHYMVAQELVQRYSKQSFTNFVSARIFKPLNMSSTTFSLAFFNESGRGSEAWASFGRRIPHWLTDGDQGLIAGAGGIMSTTKDLVQWVKVLVGAINGTEIGIPETILQTCMSAQSLVTTGESYGFGWAQQEYRGIDSPVVWHDGSLPGASALTTLLLEQQVAIVQLTNADGMEGVNKLVSTEIINAVFGLNSTGFFPSAGQDSGITSPEMNPTATADELNTYAGTYTDPAYGSIVLCSSTRPSKGCRPVLDDYATVKFEGAQLYGYFAHPKTWANYVRFAPLVSGEGNTTFGFHATTVFPHGYGANETAFEDDQAAPGTRVEFVRGTDGKVRGFGLFGLEGVDLPPLSEGKTVEETAEVWFARTD